MYVVIPTFPSRFTSSDLSTCDILPPFPFVYWVEQVGVSAQSSASDWR